MMRRSIVQAVWVATVVAGGGCDNSTVTETGYFLPGKISYTADSTLTEDSESDVLVIGEADALRDATGSLAGTRQRGDVDVSGIIDRADGSFAMVIGARLGDTVELRYDVEDTFDELALALDDDLSGAVAPVCTTCLADTDDFLGPVDAGLATVFLSALDGAMPPVVITNSDRGSVIRVDVAGDDPAIRAESGDRVCIHRVLGAGAGTALCGNVPGA